MDWHTIAWPEMVGLGLMGMLLVIGIWLFLRAG